MVIHHLDKHQSYAEDTDQLSRTPCPAGSRNLHRTLYISRVKARQKIRIRWTISIVTLGMLDSVATKHRSNAYLHNADGLVIHRWRLTLLSFLRPCSETRFPLQPDSESQNSCGRSTDCHDCTRCLAPYSTSAGARRLRLAGAARLSYRTCCTGCRCVNGSDQGIRCSVSRQFGDPFCRRWDGRGCQRCFYVGRDILG